MKRFVAILMAAAMLLTVLAGCSGSTKPADTTPAADSSTAAAETESAAPSASAITVVLSDVGNNMDPSVANSINTAKRETGEGSCGSGNCRCAESRRVHARHMAANVVRAIR